MGEASHQLPLLCFVLALLAFLFFWAIEASELAEETIPSLRVVEGADGTMVFLDREGNIVGSVSPELQREHTTLVLSPPPPQLGGWPLRLGEVESTPTVADVDGDENLEVAFGSLNGNIYVVGFDGSFLPGWPFSSIPTGNTPSLADIEGDGKLEIFVAAGFHLFGLCHDGSALPGWPQPGTGFPVVGIEDLDDDGSWEIVANDDDGKAYVWDTSGVPKPGWPFGFPSSQARSNKGPALGDTDGDGIAEIAFPIVLDPAIFLLALDGSIRPGFPINLSIFGLKQGISMADVDGDGAQELIFQEKKGGWILNGQGATLPGWPTAAIQGNSPPAIGDIDRDGRLEMVWGTTGGDAKVWAFNDDGTLVDGWPIIVPKFSFNAQATLGDIDGDGGVEIVLGGLTATFASTGRVYAWHADGTLVTGFPFAVPEGKTILGSSVTITDLDQDGDVDLLVGAITGIGGTSNGRVFAFDLDAPYDPSSMEWPTRSHDVRHTNRYELPFKKVGMEVRLAPEAFFVDHPPAVVTARLHLPEAIEADELAFHIARLDSRPVRPSIPGRVIVSRPAGRGGPDRIVQFDGGALAEALRSVAPSTTGFVLVEVESDRLERRVFSGTSQLRTGRRPFAAP